MIETSNPAAGTVPDYHLKPTSKPRSRPWLGGKRYLSMDSLWFHGRRWAIAAGYKVNASVAEGFAPF